MEYYAVKEVAKKVSISERRLYDHIRQIEEKTPHQFGRAPRGNYYMGNPKKEKVISDRDLVLIEQFYNEVDNQGVSVVKAMEEIFRLNTSLMK